MNFPTGAEIRKCFDFKENFRDLFISKGSLTSLDGWRALARIWVSLNHNLILIGTTFPLLQKRMVTDTLGRLSCHGNFGVDILFVLSGFLIGGILIRDKLRGRKINFRRFYLRRAFRILPVYFLSILIAVIANFQNLLPPDYYAGSLIPNLFFVNNFVPFHLEFMAWTWSLAIEEQFYIWCPIFISICGLGLKRFITSFLLLFLGLKTIHLFLLFNSGLSIFWTEFSVFGASDYERYFVFIYANSFVRFSQILIGVAFAYIFEKKKDAFFFSRPILPWLMVGGAASCLFFILHYMNYESTDTKNYLFEFFYRDLFALCTAILILASIHLQKLKTFFSARFFTPLSNLSYGTYVIHLLLVHFTLYNFYPHIRDFIWSNGAQGSNLQTFFFGVTSLVFGFLAAVPLYLLIEKPFLNLREHFS